MKRPGYYVERKFFGDKFHQALAHAAHLSATYGRGIDLMRRDPDAAEAVLVLTCINHTRMAA